MSKAKTDTIKVSEPPKIPMGFGKNSFGIGNMKTPNGSRGQFTPSAPRITQNKGGGGK